MNEQPNQTRVEELLCLIAHRQKVASECQAEESRMASSRNSAESDAANGVIALAKELKEALGDPLVCRLVSELVTLTNWRPPTPMEAR
jgi:hypothetical protein